MNSKCVYRHIKKDGTVFYIGMGEIKRAYSKASRNVFWERIVKKEPNYEVNILKKNMSLEDALDLEIMLIDYYGRRYNKTGSLCNITEGGEGTTGVNHKSRAVYQYSKKGKLIKKWNNGVKEILKNYNVKERSLRSALDNSRNKSSINYYWSYEPTSEKYILELFKNSLIYQVDLNGAVINKFKTNREAAKELKVDENNLGKCSATKNTYNQYKGFFWIKASNEKELKGKIKDRINNLDAKVKSKYNINKL